MINYLVFDIENNSSPESKALGRKAGHPMFDPLVAIGLKNQQELKSIYIYPNKIKEFKIDEDIIVGHNLAHDLQWFWHLDDLQDFFKKGGKIWDTSVVEYILTAQEHKYPALRDIAGNKYGCPERKKYIEDLLFNKDETIKKLVTEFETEQDLFKKHAIREEIKQLEGHYKVSDLPRAAVLKDVENDVLDTEQVFLKQYEQVGRLGLHAFVELQMDAVLATIECSMNGMKIDLDKLRKNKIELQQQLDIKTKELLDIVKGYWK